MVGLTLIQTGSGPLVGSAMKGRAEVQGTRRRFSDSKSTAATRPASLPRFRARGRGFEEAQLDPNSQEKSRSIFDASL